MPRNISFALTTKQIRDRSKTVTRRQGWATIRPGTVLQPVEKGMGLKKGEKVVKIGGLIEVVSVSREPLNAITIEDVIAEGFPEWTCLDFVEFYAKHNRIRFDDLVNRIEFKYCEQ